MSYKVVYFDEVQQDIKEAKRWYRKQSVALEKRFASDMKSSIQHIAIYPYSCAIRYKNVRIAHPYIFPYSVHYYIDEMNATIVIIAIVHNSRNPPYSQQRL